MAGAPGTSHHRADRPAADDQWLSHGIPLGRWAGAPVSAHWSALFTLLLFADLLAVSVLPAARPRESTAAYWLIGSATAVAFLAFVMAHEFAHAVIARHFGMRIRGITLWMLGGATTLDGEPSTPRADASIAFAGPAASLVLGAATYALSVWVGTSLVGVALAWLGGVNVLLGVFNLLPGAPLDGGRLLRALLWARYRDRARAAAAAGRTGRALGFAFVGLGLLELLAGSLLGTWLVLLGWYINSAATAEQVATRLSTLRGVRAGQVMTPVDLAAPDWWTVEQFVERLGDSAARQAVYPLVDFGGSVSAVLTLPDLRRVPPAQRGERRLRDAAGTRRPRPLVVPADADVGELVPQLAAHGGVAVVVTDGQPVGVITEAELGRAAGLAELRGTDHAGPG